MNERWYDKTVAQIEESLNTDINTGLMPDVLRSRQKNDEMNVVFPVKRYSFKDCLKKTVSDSTTLVLVVTALISAALENQRTSWIIISLIIFNILVSVFTYYKSKKIFEDMSKLSLPTTKVMRNGKMYLIKSEQLIKGDIIYLSAGDMVPADARIVESDNLQVLEVNLTGEIKPTEKDPNFLKYSHDVPPAQQANMVFASTIVIKGTAKAVCCCTGQDTLVCKLDKAKSLTSYDDITAISFMKKFGKVWSLSMIALVFIIVFLMLFFNQGQNGLMDIFLTALSLAVATTGTFFEISTHIIVANGLFSAVKQNRHVNSGALIKNISKIEKLKDVTCLLVHKEGALSIREARVEKVFVNNMLYADGEVNFERNASRALRFALISTGLYGAGNIVKNNLNNENIYSPEEDAIINISQKCKVYNIKLDKEFPILEHRPKGELSRFETTLVNSASGYIAASRGSLNEILSSCSYYAENGNIYPFDPQRKAEIVEEATRLNRQSYRVIAIASKPTQYNTLRRIISCQTDMIFEGFIAMRERLLPGAAKSIADCQAAGIKVIMLCDDSGEHNKLLAETLGIVKKPEEMTDGAYLSQIRDELFRTNINMYTMYENLSIYQKRKILSFLHDEGEVVGVLARELDEIILLKDADVSFLQSTTLSGKLDKSGLDLALAKNTSTPMMIKSSKASKKTGSEALKFIADVIVSDADKKGNGGFNAMLNALVASKVIYKNLYRFVNYLLTTNVARMLLVIYSIISSNNTLEPIQILFSGLIIDFIAMIVITFESADNKMILQTNTTEELLKIHKVLPLAFLAGIIFAGSIIILPMFAEMLGLAELASKTSIIFLSFIFAQVCVMNECLKDESIFKPTIRYNRAHLIMAVVVIGFVLSVLFVEPFAQVFGLTSTTWHSIILSIVPSLLLIIIYEVQKIIGTK